MSDLRHLGLTVCRLLGDAANGRTYSLPSLPDENALLAFAKAHRIVTIVSNALNTCGFPKERYAALHSLAEQAAFHQIKNDLFCESLLLQLQEAHITPTVMKGAVIQAAYPEGWIRTASDIDLYIPHEQLDSATAELLARQFELVDSGDVDRSFHKLPRTNVELHTSLGGFSNAQRQTLRAMCDNGFTSNEHYVYTVFHLYKHFLLAGAGIRLFFDIDRLSKTITDRQTVDRLLNAMDLRGFESAVSDVNRVLFNGAPCPDTLSETIDFLFGACAFGTNENYQALKSAARPVTHKRASSVWLHDYCFDLPSMKARYPVLQHHVWMYPFCAVHRVGYGLLFRRKVIKDVANANRAVDRHKVARILKEMNIV